MKGRVIVAVLLAALSGSAWAQSTVTFLGLDFPKSIGGFSQQGTHDYEATNPGLGYSVRYTRAAWWADVYIYDLGKKAIPDGPDNVEAKGQYNQASSDIMRAVEAGIYRKAEPLGTFSMPRSGPAKFNCGAFATVQANGKALDSLLCVTGYHNKFVKFRISAPSGKSSAKEVETFINAWGEKLAAN